jgi:AcrR family transcriptional regulator
MSLVSSSAATGNAGRRSSAQTRELILAVAGELFYTEGIRATGVDAVAAAAAVAPTTLYRLFASKDELVAAYVTRCGKHYRSVLGEAIARVGGDPRARLLAVFHTFAEDTRTGSCRGCPFLMVLSEFPDPQHPAHVAAVAHKAWLRSLLGDLVGELAATAALPDPVALREHLTLVAEGMYASVQALGADGPAAAGPACAAALVEAALAGAAPARSARPTAAGEV